MQIPNVSKNCTKHERICSASIVIVPQHARDTKEQCEGYEGRVLRSELADWPGTTGISKSNPA